jgi:amino acid transporter
MLLTVVFVPLRLIGNLASLFSLLGFIVVNVAVIRLRRQKPALSRPFLIPLYPLPPLIGIGLNVLLGLYISPRTWVIALAWLVVGGFAYVAWEQYKNRTERTNATETSSEEHSL